jgi:anti-sigma28 factor (negative regulator of flagellin synthesis)
MRHGASPLISDTHDLQMIGQCQGISGAVAQEVIGNMDITMNSDTYPESGPVRETKAVALHVHDVHHVSETTGAGSRTDLSLWVVSELACRLVYGAEVREAKIRELQASIKNGNYHVPAEQIADKMLRSTLQHDLT